MESQQIEVLLWLKSTCPDSLFGTVRGNLFEAVAHNVLCQGGEFDVRVLKPKNRDAAAASLASSEGDITRMRLPACSRLQYNVLEEVERASATQFCTSSAFNQESVYAVTQVRAICCGERRMGGVLVWMICEYGCVVSLCSRTGCSR